ncbi:MAG: mismatch repair protein [Acidobacteriaceae bacterium]
MEAVEAVYRRLFAENRGRVDGERRRHLWLGYGKLAIFLIGVVEAGVLVHTRGPFLLLLIPLAIFMVLIVVHDRVLRRLGRYERMTEFYARGLARIENQWAGTGETGDRFFDAAHPYARDLDLFGKGSLFELLCTARTRAGEEIVARWLLAAAEPEEVRARQAAVAEMKDGVTLRERLFLAGEHVRAGVHPEELAAWGEGKPDFQSRWLPWVLALLAVLWVASMMAWIASLLAGDVTRNLDPAILMSLINYAVSYGLQRRVNASAEGVEKAAEDLQVLAEVLEIMEGEGFEAERLRRLRARLNTGGIAPSAAVKKLERIYDWLKDQRNGFVRIFNAFVFYVAQFTMAAERWRAQYGPAIRGWLEAVGEFEALAALSGYAYEHPLDVMAELVEEQPCFDAEGLAHPLLPSGKAVGNDLRLGRAPQLMVISGPNMAGKSTFLRGVGLNAVLAQCGAPVRAKRLRMSPVTVGASICVLDSLAGGVSRFYAEIQRLKVLSDLAGGAAPLLFLLDELLSGTNSHDRFEGTRFVARELVSKGGMGLVTTHDLALTAIPETMDGAGANWHFEDSIEDGQLKFDYRLKPGVVQTSNALKLMQAVGLKVS